MSSFVMELITVFREKTKCLTDEQAGRLLGIPKGTVYVWRTRSLIKRVQKRHREKLCEFTGLQPEIHAKHAKPKTENMGRLSKRELERERLTNPTPEHDRPLTRGDCLEGGSNAERPCPFVSCKHHLYLDVNLSSRNGSIKYNYPTLDVSELKESCALDVADRGGITLEETGLLLNCTRENVRKIELRVLNGLRKHRLLPVLHQEL